MRITCLEAAHGCLKDLRNFFIWQSFKKAEDKDEPLFLGKAGEGRVQTVRYLSFFRGAMPCVCFGEESRKQFALPEICHDLLFPNCIEREIHRDPVEPRGKCRVISEIPQSKIRSDEGFLRNFIRIIMVSCNVPNDPVDVPLMPLHQPGERNSVSRPNQLNELNVRCP